MAKTSPHSDLEVVARVLNGDRSLFEVLMRRYNRTVYRAVRSILKSESECEDAMQQTYIAAFSHLAQFNGTSKFSTWLVRIAINEALARLRRERRIEQGGRNMTTTDQVELDDPERRAGAHEMIALIEDSVEKLPEIHRVVFMLRDVEGFDTAETAEALGVSEDVVKQRLHRARESIRKELFDRVGETAVGAFAFHERRCDAIVLRVTRHLFGAGTSDHT